MAGSYHKTLQDSIQVPNRTSSLEKVRDFVIRSLERTGLDDRSKHLMVLAIDEAVTSNILFSVETRRDGQCKVSIDIDPVRIKVTLEDSVQYLDVSQVTDSVLNETFVKAREH